MKGLGILFFIWSGICTLVIILGLADANNPNNAFAVLVNYHFLGLVLNVLISALLGIFCRNAGKTKEQKKMQNGSPVNIQPGAMLYDPNTQQYYTLQPAQQPGQPTQDMNNGNGIGG